MHTRFSEENRKGKALFSLMSANIPKVKAELRDLVVKLKFWEAGLPMPFTLLAGLKENGSLAWL